MINWFDMPAEGLSNGGQFEVKELEVTENGTYEEKGEMYNKVTVNVEGGGGGESDFSTANLTITNTTNNFIEFLVPNYKDSEEVLTVGLAIAGAFFDTPTTETFNVACKSNGAVLRIVTTGVNATILGNIQYIENQNLYIIKGDCAITVSGSQPV